MSWDPSVGTFQSTLPPLAPLVSPSTFASSGARTEIDPKFSIFGSLASLAAPSTAVLANAYIAAHNALTNKNSTQISGGTVIATFLGTDLAQPYNVTSVGLTKNFPVLPNQSFPVVGALMLDDIDTALYATFSVPSNIVSSTLTVKLGVCLDTISGNADITGTVACFGVSANPLIPGQSTVDDSDLPVDAPTVTGKLPTVVGGFYSFSMLVNTNSIAPGAIHLIRVTRKAGSSKLDTHTGRLLLVALEIIAS